MEKLELVETANASVRSDMMQSKIDSVWAVAREDELSQECIFLDRNKHSKSRAFWSICISAASRRKFMNGLD